ncbi:MAG TPA: hypothetical protein VF795_11745 [Desulfuromonadaceae bacterium]
MLKRILDHLKWRRTFGRTKRILREHAEAGLIIALVRTGALTPPKGVGTRCV